MDPENYSDWFDEKDRLRLAKKTRHDNGHRTAVSRSPAQALSREVPTATDDSTEHSPLFLLGIHQHWSIGPLVAVAITLVFQAMFYWSMKRPKKSLDRGNNVDTSTTAGAAAAENNTLRSPARRTPASPPTFSNKRPRLDSSHLVSDDSDHEDNFTVRPSTSSTTTTSFCTPPRPERRLIVARRSASSLDRRNMAPPPLERRLPQTTPRRRVGRVEAGPDVPDLVGEWARPGFFLESRATGSEQEPHHHAMTALGTASPAGGNALVLGTPNFHRGGGNQLAVVADSPAASLFNRGVVHTAVALQQVLNAGVQPAALQMAMDHDARERQLLVAVQLEAVRQTHESTERNLDRSARREDSTWYTRLQEDRKLALRKIFSCLSSSLLVSFAIRLSPLLYLVYNAEIVKVRRLASRLSAE
jgi:hypothetical protein